jgi:WD40 repeat protein
MKKGKIIVWLLLLILAYLVYSQLFKQPKLVEGNYIELTNTFTHDSGEVWEVKFAPNDTLMVSNGIDPNTKIWNRITGK